MGSHRAVGEMYENLMLQRMNCARLNCDYAAIEAIVERMPDSDVRGALKVHVARLYKITERASQGIHKARSRLGTFVDTMDGAVGLC